MDVTRVVQLIQDHMATGLWILTPILVFAFLIAIIIGIFQAMSQINEQTLSFAPKLVVIGVLMILMGPLMFDKLVTMVRDSIKLGSTLF